MSRGRLVFIAVLLVILLLSAAYGVYYTNRPTKVIRTSNVSSSMTTHSSSVSASPSTVTRTVCSQSICNSSSSSFNGYASTNTTSTNVSSICSLILAPPPQGVYLQLINDQGAPLPDLQVVATGQNPDWCPPQPQYNETSGTTNSTGWAFFEDVYISSIGLNYSGTNYNFTIAALPMAWTIATLRIPGGILTVHICGLGGSDINSYCGAPTYTVLIRPQNDNAPFAPYYVRFWSNSSNPVISNISVSTAQTWPPVAIEFWVSQPAIVFASPAVGEINPDSNGTLFAFSYPNGTRIASTLIKNENILSTNETVSDWVEVVSWPA